MDRISSYLSRSSRKPEPAPAPLPPQNGKAGVGLSDLDSDLSKMLGISGTDESIESTAFKSKGLEQQLTELADCPADDEEKFRSQLKNILEHVTRGLGLERDKEKNFLGVEKMLKNFPWNDADVVTALKETALALQSEGKPSFAQIIYSQFEDASLPFLHYNHDYDIEYHSHRLDPSKEVDEAKFDMYVKKNADQPNRPIAAYFHAQQLFQRGEVEEGKIYMRKFQDSIESNPLVKGIAAKLGLKQPPLKPLPDPASEPSLLPTRPVFTIRSFIDNTPYNQLDPKVRLKPDVPAVTLQPAQKMQRQRNALASEATTKPLQQRVNPPGPINPSIAMQPKRSKQAIQPVNRHPIMSDAPKVQKMNIDLNAGNDNSAQPS